MENGNRYVSSVAITCAPQIASRDANGLDRWTSFLQLYEPFIACKLAQQHPQFARALLQLERDSRLELERQSAQVLATLKVKDTKISELQNVVSEQQEQLDVVLDELERRETKEDKGVQFGIQRQKEDASVQTETIKKDIETQTEKFEGESGALVLLEKLEKELKTLEEKNLILERELQQRVMKREEDVTEYSEDIDNVLEILQQGVDAMNLSCGCVDNPLVFFVGAWDESDEKESVTMSTCVNLEHRLQAQAVRLEHVQECLYLWRDAAVLMMKRLNQPSCAARPTLSPPLASTRDEKPDSGEMSCSFALRGALSQLRHHAFRFRGKSCNDKLYDLKELANLLAKGKNGAKMAAKIVQKWAGWEAKHLEEVRALRKGFNEEIAVANNRRTVLLKRIFQLEQRELDIQAEVNTLKKTIKFQGGLNTRHSLTSSPENESSRKVDKCDELLEYPQLALRLATAEQSLLAKNEQLTAANNTIRALSSCTPASTHTLSSSTVISRNGASMNRLAMELQSASKQKLEFFQKREKDLISLGQYFQMEKLCLQLQSRIGAEQKRAAITKAAMNVCERERDELFVKVEKLEAEAILAKLTRRSTYTIT
ncbi:Hypothetical protein PHPALM_37266 [Phytophthora palmivora]|uniref:Uncharacterized protein n=1 Tax=Phytophthora palmivora TaxID=4796 RepID=A0A2P4WXU5_9STRA|nr:Hypothetical protein PHPALM_37266 [Phytophthora palmivora]